MEEAEEVEEPVELLGRVPGNRAEKRRAARERKQRSLRLQRARSVQVVYLTLMDDEIARQRREIIQFIHQSPDSLSYEFFPGSRPDDVPAAFRAFFSSRDRYEHMRGRAAAIAYGHFSLLQHLLEEGEDGDFIVCEDDCQLMFSFDTLIETIVTLDKDSAEPVLMGGQHFLGSHHETEQFLAGFGASSYPQVFDLRPDFRLWYGQGAIYYPRGSIARVLRFLEEQQTCHPLDTMFPKSRLFPLFTLPALFVHNDVCRSHHYNGATGFYVQDYRLYRGRQPCLDALRRLQEFWQIPVV